MSMPHAPIVPAAPAQMALAPVLPIAPAPKAVAKAMVVAKAKAKVAAKAKAKAVAKAKAGAKAKAVARAQAKARARPSFPRFAPVTKLPPALELMQNGADERAARTPRGRLYGNTTPWSNPVCFLIARYLAQLSVEDRGEWLNKIMIFRKSSFDRIGTHMNRIIWAETLRLRDKRARRGLAMLGVGPIVIQQNGIVRG